MSSNNAEGTSASAAATGESATPPAPPATSTAPAGAPPVPATAPAAATATEATADDAIKGAGDKAATTGGASGAPGGGPKLTKAQKRAQKRRAKKAAKKAAKAKGGTVSGVTGPSGTLTTDKLISMMRQRQLEAMGRKEEEASNKSHAFWDKQPVPKMTEVVTEHGPLDKDKTPDDVRAEPLALVAGFEWAVIDVKNPKHREELFNLLAKNYVEDDDNVFRFRYPQEFLLWALTPPGYFPEWLVGVRQTSNKRLRAFISGIPAHTRIHGRKVLMCEINFLCVHKKLRSKRLAPVLIKEVTRRVNRRNIWQAVYTAGVVIPKPVGACRYWHRSLNVRKLIEVEFSRLQPRMTLNRTIRLFKLPAETLTPGFRPMEEKDVAAVTKLMHTYLAKFNLWVEWDEAETKHWMLPRKGVINSYVVENSEGVVTDVCSFYHLPSSIIGHPKHDTLNAAYSFYNVATSTTLEALMKDLLITAKNANFDVMNCLDLMENSQFLKNLKFGIGDGTLNYYLYNWGCPTIESKDVGLVLL